jgi:hypothetical protein
MTLPPLRALISGGRKSLAEFQNVRYNARMRITIATRAGCHVARDFAFLQCRRAEEFFGLGYGR